MGVATQENGLFLVGFLFDIVAWNRTKVIQTSPYEVFEAGLHDGPVGTLGRLWKVKDIVVVLCISILEKADDGLRPTGNGFNY